MSFCVQQTNQGASKQTTKQASEQKSAIEQNQQTSTRTRTHAHTHLSLHEVLDGLDQQNMKYYMSYVFGCTSLHQYTAE